MSYGFLNRAFETTDDTGSGDLDLDGNVSGFQSIVDAAKEASGTGTGPWNVEVVVTDVPNGGTNWEVIVCNIEEGTGVGGKDRLKKSTGNIKASSNSGSPVSWGSGIKNVFGCPQFKKGSAFFDKLSSVGVVKRLGVESYSILTDGFQGRVVLAAATEADVRAAAGAQQNVITTRGDLVVGDSTPAAARLPISGSTGKFLKGGTDPAWTTPTTGDITRTPTAAVPGSTTEAALTALAPSLATYAQTNAKTGVTTEDGLDDIQAKAFPGGADSTKLFVVWGQVTFTSVDSGETVTVRVRWGTNGTEADSNVECVAAITSGANSATKTVFFYSKPFAPANGNLWGVTVQGSGSVDIGTADSDRTYAVVQKIANA